jgi:hypothetical protein
MSTKNSIITGKNFYIFSECFEEEKGVFIKFFKPSDIKLVTSEGSISEVEVCIKNEDWKEFMRKIKQFEEEI